MRMAKMERREKTPYEEDRDNSNADKDDELG
jgi:hypothetical protein